MEKTQKMFRSFIKNGKERKNVAFFWKERMPNPTYNMASPLTRGDPGYQIKQVCMLYKHSWASLNENLAAKER